VEEPESMKRGVLHRTRLECIHEYGAPFANAFNTETSCASAIHLLKRHYAGDGISKFH